jgi:hypothetical protein
VSGASLSYGSARTEDAVRRALSAGLLEQAGLSTLFYADEGRDILFLELGAVLEKIGPPTDATAGR